MTTWAQSVRHPWFNSPTMKRKLFADDDASFSSDVSPATFSTSRRKRIRYGSLERTLAHMTLGSALTTSSEDVDVWPKISAPRPCEQETLDVILPSSVEEPSAVAPEPVDADMEVEPTEVLTDAIDTEAPTPRSVHDWESVASGQLDIKELQISSAVLDCLRKQSKCPHAPIPLPSQTSHALVPYRAPQPPSPKSWEQAHDDRQGKPTRTSLLVAHEEDVMEVE